MPSSRRQFLGTLGLTAAATSFSGNTVGTSNPQFTGSRLIKNSATLSALVPTDEGFVAAGHTESPLNAILVSYDNSGDKRWYWRYEFEDTMTVSDAIPYDDGYLIAGRAKRHEWHGIRPLLLSVDADRQVKWMNPIDSEGRPSRNISLKQLPDGKVSIAWEEANTHSMTSYIAVVDKRGDIIWKKKLESTVFQGLARNGDRLFLTGFVEAGIVHIYSLDGTHQRSIQLDYYPRTIAPTTSGFAVTTGYPHKEKSTSNIIQLAAYSSAGEQEWARKYDISSGSVEPVCTLALQDGFVILVQETEESDQELTALIRTDTDGKHLWTATRTDAHYDEKPRAVIQTGKNQFVVAGSATGDGWLAFVDKLRATTTQTSSRSPHTTTATPSVNKSTGTTNTEVSGFTLYQTLLALSGCAWFSGRFTDWLK